MKKERKVKEKGFGCKLKVNIVQKKNSQETGGVCSIRKAIFTISYRMK
jgi:hypothetical protein